MNFRPQPLMLGFALCALLSCKRSTNVDPVSPGDTVKVSKGVDVYLTGASLASGGTVKVAAYWKNGIQKKIKDSLSATTSSARDIVLSGSDVYLIGNKGIATAVWKNGSELTPITGTGNGLVVNNNDVYIYGYAIVQGKSTGKYWKNGTVVDVPQCAQLSGLAVSGNDVYVSGMSQTTKGKLVAAYWKNGVRTMLSADTTINSFTTCITLNGSNVYVGGQSTTLHAIYWKNGTPVDLSAASSSGVGQITFKNGDMYCLGYKKVDPAAGTASYWKNDVRKDVINDPAASINSKISGIATAGTDIYLAGFLGSIGYWKGSVFTGYANTTFDNYVNIKLVERY